MVKRIKKDLTPWQQFLQDLKELFLPDNDTFREKVKCRCTQGERVGFYYKEDLEYAEECYGKDNDLHTQPPYSGILIGRPGMVYGGGELDIEDLVLVIDSSPCEKCYPEISWVTLGRILNDQDLVEIFSLE